MLDGVSADPDPARFAYRKDLADVALAGEVIASHYAKPVMRELHREARLRVEPDEDAPVIATLPAGAPFALLDSRGGWSWGYGGDDRLVGYLSEEALL